MRAGTRGTGISTGSVSVLRSAVFRASVAGAALFLSTPASALASEPGAAAAPPPVAAAVQGDAPASASTAAGQAAPASAEARYPFEVRTPFHAGLFHWLDSIAGTSGGKTIPVYREEFARRFRGFSPTDRGYIRAFREARVFFADGGRTLVDPPRSAGMTDGMSAPVQQVSTFPPHGSSAMLGAFLEADSMEESFARLSGEMDRSHVSALRQALENFRHRYQAIWDDAAYLPRFVSDLARPENLRPIERYLAELARFFGVSATDPPRPRLVLVPVPGDGGTHAQAVDRNLLLEIRPGDKPLGQISVIAHENSHFMFLRIPEVRRRRLEEAARRAAPGGDEVWELLHEALPTALGQGVAQARTFPHEFSQREAWYHIRSVDELAKKIFPIVDRALSEGRLLDEELVAEMVRAAGPAAGKASSR